MFGSNGVYAATSSVCRAAIHAGLIKSGGIVNVSIESPRKSYEGSVQNGIVSSALERTPGTAAIRSIRLGTVFRVRFPRRTAQATRAIVARTGLSCGATGNRSCSTGVDIIPGRINRN